MRFAENSITIAVPVTSPAAKRLLHVPLYTIAEAATIVDVPVSTFGTWAKGYSRHPPNRAPVRGKAIITYVPAASPKEPTIPFVGLAEGLVLAAMRRSGVPMQRIRPALAKLQESLGVEHALATKKLYTDGAELLFNYAEEHPRSEAGRLARELVVVRTGQRVFAEIIDAYLRRIEYGPDGYARLIRVPAYENARVLADPARAFGAPIFERGGARVTDVLQRFHAGESLDEVSSEFGVPKDELEDVVRVASRKAA